MMKDRFLSRVESFGIFQIISVDGKSGRVVGCMNNENCCMYVLVEFDFFLRYTHGNLLAYV